MASKTKDDKPPISKGYHENLPKLEPLLAIEDLEYFYQPRSKGADSYGKMARRALEDFDAETLSQLPLWYKYIFPFPRRRIVRGTSDGGWKFCIGTAIRLLSDKHWGWRIGFAVRYFLGSKRTFVEAVFSANDGFGDWIQRWLEAFDAVLWIERVEKDLVTRKVCGDTLEWLQDRGYVTRSSKLVGDEREDVDELKLMKPSGLYKMPESLKEYFRQYYPDIFTRDPSRVSHFDEGNREADRLLTSLDDLEEEESDWDDEAYCFDMDLPDSPSSRGSARPEIGDSKHPGDEPVNWASTSQGQYTTYTDNTSYRRPTVTMKVPKSHLVGPGYSHGPQMAAYTDDNKETRRKMWIRILESFQRDNMFRYEHRNDMGIVFPYPKNVDASRGLLESRTLAFRLGYATMVLKQTLTRLNALHEENPRGPGTQWKKSLEDSVKNNTFIRRCMTITHAVLQLDGVETDEKARNICREVMDSFWGVQYKGDPKMLDMVKKLKKQEKVYVNADRVNNDEDASKIRTKETWFQRGMMVAEKLDAVPLESDELLDEGILWKSHDLSDELYWQKRWTGMAWLELENARPKMIGGTEGRREKRG